MLGLLLPLAVTSVVAAMWAGSLAGLQQLRIRWWPLAMGSIAVQLVLFTNPVDRQPWAMAWGPTIWVLCLIGMLTVLIRNGLTNLPGRNGFRLAALGVAANLFVVLANRGYMPQSPEGRLAVGGVALVVDGAPTQLRNVVTIGPATPFAWLGDIIAQPSWLPTANVVSVGDVVLSVALALWAFRVITSHNWRASPLR